MKITARRYDTGSPATFQLSGGLVSQVEELTGRDTDLWIAPGFVDLQVNGYGGQEFNDLELNVEKVGQISRLMDQDGVTSYLPTATTHSFEMLSSTMRTLAAACRESQAVARRVPGFHLEGPYISPQDGPRGAHPLEHCRPPDWEEFQRLQEAADGKIRILTLSPEYPDSAPFIRKVADSGVVVALGHTAADSDQIQAAADAGATMSTHLGNGAHGQLPRHPNYLWDQLAEDRLMASLIVDGHHLPRNVVKTFLNAKTLERSVLVSDLVGMAGMPPGRYHNTSIGDIEILDDGRLVVAGQRQYLAGAGLPITYGVANVMRYAGLELKDAVDLAAARPARIVGAPLGGLEPGEPAHLVLFRLPDDQTGPLQVQATINAGDVVYGTVPDSP